MIEFRINQSHLKAVALAAAKKDRRDYLNGVRIEVYTDHVIMVATDGHQIVAVNTFCDTGLDGEKGVPSCFTLHNNHLSTILSVKTSKYNHFITFTYDEGNAGWKAEVAGVFFEVGNKNENDFVNWRRVVPRSVSGETAQFDINLLTTVHKAAALFKGETAKNVNTTVRVFHNGEKAAIVRDSENDNFLAVVMPLRDTTLCSDPLVVPGWFFREEEVQ